MTRSLVTSLLVAGALAGCTDDTREARFELTRLGSCADVRDRIRAQAIANMEERLAEARQRALQQACSPFVGDLEDADAGADNSSDGAGGGTAGGGGGGPTQTSGTNNQVAGVDEADFVKNDGRLPLHRQRRQAAHHRRVAARAGARRLGDRDRGRGAQALRPPGPRGRLLEPRRPGGPPVPRVHLRLQLRLHRRRPPDEGDRLRPRRPREPARRARDPLSGSLLAARRIGAGVHTVVTEHAPAVAELQFQPPGIDACTPNIAKMWAFDRLRRKNLDLLERSDFDLFLPSAIDSQDGDLGGRCDQFYGADVGDGSEVTSLVSLDVTDQHGAAFTSIVSRPGAVYASADALYMAVRHRDSEDDEAEQRSTIHKFAIATGAARHAVRRQRPRPGPRRSTSSRWTSTTATSASRRRPATCPSPDVAAAR